MSARKREDVLLKPNIYKSLFWKNMHAFEITLLKRNFSKHLIIAAFMSFPLPWKNMHAFEAVRSRKDYRNSK